MSWAVLTLTGSEAQTLQVAAKRNAVARLPVLHQRYHPQVRFVCRLAPALSECVLIGAVFLAITARGSTANDVELVDREAGAADV